jgi:hypothetical protein
MDPGDREWESGNMWHGRGLVSHIETFMLVGETWVPNGTVTVTGGINLTARSRSVIAPSATSMAGSAAAWEPAEPP